MTIKPTVKIDPEDTIRYLLYQQFYYGDDKIYGRTKDYFEHIRGAGEAIEQFYNMITKPINLIDEGNPKKYLEFFNEKIFPVPINTIMDKYQEYETIMASEMDREIILTVIVGESLAEIHEKCFKATIEVMIDHIIERKPFSIKNRKEIKQRIKTLYGKSNTYIGIIYSLSFMEFIAKKIENKNIAKKCEHFLKKYFNLVIRVLRE